jgi:hypothetical protein
VQQFNEAGAEVKLKVLIRYLVLSFPEAGVLSRQVEERYHVFVIVPYGGGPEKTIQVERAVLTESARSIKDFECCLSELNLPLWVQTHERYELTAGSIPRLGEAIGFPATEDWPVAQTHGTVEYGPVTLQVCPHHRFPGVH